MRTKARSRRLATMRGVSVCLAGLGLLWGTTVRAGEVVAETGAAPTSRSYELTPAEEIDAASSRLAEEAAPQDCCESSCGGCDGGGCGTCGQGWLGDCELGEPFSLSGSMLDDDLGIDIGGWTQWGYHSESNGLFNNHDSRFNNHQSWLYAEKAADGSYGWDWGFRADLMYGVDSADTQAFGEPVPQDHWDNDWDHGIYGWALPQLYGVVERGDWSVRFGHFYTRHGYEVVQAPDNFFYSHAYTMFNSEPFTHTGVMLRYEFAEDALAFGGWTAGWDTGFDAFSDGDNSDGSMFLGGVGMPITDNLTGYYTVSSGDFGVRGEGYAQSLVLDAQLTENLNYIFHTDLVETNARVFNDQFSINQYLIYTVNDCWATGARLEWWKNDGNSQYEITYGVNYRPHANLVLRPEIRHDWNPGNQNIVGKDNFTTFGVDAILTF